MNFDPANLKPGDEVGIVSEHPGGFHHAVSRVSSVDAAGIHLECDVAFPANGRREGPGWISTLAAPTPLIRLAAMRAELRDDLEYFADCVTWRLDDEQLRKAKVLMMRLKEECGI